MVKPLRPQRTGCRCQHRWKDHPQTLGEPCFFLLDFARKVPKSGFENIIFPMFKFAIALWFIFWGRSLQCSDTVQNHVNWLYPRKSPNYLPTISHTNIGKISTNYIPYQISQLWFTQDALRGWHLCALELLCGGPPWLQPEIGLCPQKLMVFSTIFPIKLY